MCVCVREIDREGVCVCVCFCVVSVFVTLTLTSFPDSPQNAISSSEGVKKLAWRER